MNAVGAVEAELLNTREVSKLLSISPASVRRLDASGSMPKPIRLGKSLRWRRSELSSWIVAGSPNRKDWTAIQDAATRRTRR